MEQTIYRYNNDFDKDQIIEKMSELSEKIEEEKNKDEYNKERVRELLYAQFLQGLKLSIR